MAAASSGLVSSLEIWVLVDESLMSVLPGMEAQGGVNFPFPVGAVCDGMFI